MLDNTVVVFLSDNGGEAAKLQAMFPEYYAKNFDLSYQHLGEKGSYSEYGPGWASTSMTPFTNFKGSAAEGGVRAPFIIRYPGHVVEGGRSDAFAYVLDVVPTLLAYANVKTKGTGSATYPGDSMASVLAGKAKLIHPLISRSAMSPLAARRFIWATTSWCAACRRTAMANGGSTTSRSIRWSRRICPRAIQP